LTNSFGVPFQQEIWLTKSDQAFSILCLKNTLIPFAEKLSYAIAINEGLDRSKF
jgi:hypothetical protein